MTGCLSCYKDRNSSDSAEVFNMKDYLNRICRNAIGLKVLLREFTQEQVKCFN